MFAYGEKHIMHVFVLCEYYMYAAAKIALSNMTLPLTATIILIISAYYSDTLN
jgi:hypothetical protein